MTMKCKEIKPKTQEEWLELRRTRYGGSEAAAIMQLNRFMTPRDVYMKKKGLVPDEEMSLKMKLGIYLEDGVARLWESETGHRIIKKSAETVYYIHPEYDFIGGTPDRRIVLKEGGKALLEVKTTSASFDHDAYPDSWLVQLTFYMGLLGMKKGFIVWLELKKADYKWIEVDFDQEMYDHIINSLVNFHNNHILADVEPDPINVNDIIDMYPRHSPGLKIMATETLEKNYNQIIQMQNAIKPYQDKIDAMKDEVKMAMGESEAVIGSGDTLLFTWKSSSEKPVFDEQGFRKFDPDLYKSFLIEKPGSRRFLIK